jgi:YD repeat-containing protein
VKIILSLTLATCLLTACRPKNNYLHVIDNDWKIERLKGRVKSIFATIQYDFYTRKSFKEFDKNGFLVNRVDSIYGSSNYYYNYRYNYDTVNRTTVITEIESNGQSKLEENKYDDVGNLLANTHGGGTWEYKYDSKRRKVKEWVYDGKDLRSKYEIEYKPDGSSISIRYNGETGLKTNEETTKERESVDLSLDEAGNVIAKWVVRTDTVKNTTVVEGWERGKLILKTKHWYNEFRDEIKEIKLNIEKNRYDTLVSEYTYDKMGNWTNIKGSRSESREIIYW